jgi:hypothetical protein
MGCPLFRSVTKALSYLCLTAAASTAFGQWQTVSIVGVVIATGPHGMPLEGAEVSIVGIGSSITTKSGQFSIPVSTMEIGEKVTFEVTMPGWHLPSDQPREITLPRDPVHNPLRFKMERDNTTARLARELSPGFYLSHLVGRVGDERGPTTASVWLSAVGSDTYIVDSIHIAHHPGNLTSVGTGADRPDATYSFKFRSGSNETCPLVPALRLDKQDRHEVWFTLGLAPTGVFASTGGWVEVALNYHTEGHHAQGSLPLVSPPQDAILLSKLFRRDLQFGGEPGSFPVPNQFILNTNPRIPPLADGDCGEDAPGATPIRDGMRVSPLGLVKGNDESDRTALVYSELELDRQLVDYYTGMPDLPRPTNPVLALDENRKRLNAAIAGADLVPKIVRGLHTGQPVMFDLCAGLLDRRCYAALSDLVKDQQVGTRALHAIMLHHVLSPDSRFPDAVIRSLADPAACSRSFTRSNEFSAALVIKPTGEWLEALLAIANCGAASSSAALRALSRSRQPLSPGEEQHVRDVCKALLNSEFPEIEAADCLLNRGVSLNEINSMLDRLPLGVDDSDRQRAKAWRATLKEQLKGKLGDTL